jgi:hypothetical protein
MPDDFGSVHSILHPILERVGREERLSRDHPRKNREAKSERARADQKTVEGPPDQAEENVVSMSSTHIDLRI